jgi:shikimate dehydrogenase
MIDGRTRIIAHLGDPTDGFRSPMIYNPYFESIGVNAAVVPMGVRAADYPAALRLILNFTNVHGALVTMPHKVTTLSLVDTASQAAVIAGACNAVIRRPDGSLYGDLFDGEGFVRGLARKGIDPAGRRALVVGSGGVGSAIAASLAVAGIAHLSLFDKDAQAADALADRLVYHRTGLSLAVGSRDPEGHDIAVNATPLGMKADDPLPFDPDRLSPGSFVGEVVMADTQTPLVHAARTRGLPVQEGLDMLFEQIPVYLDFFGFPTTTPERLRALARLS